MLLSIQCPCRKPYRHMPRMRAPISTLGPCHDIGQQRRCVGREGCDDFQSLDDTDVGFVYENWRSRAGMDAQMRAPHLQAFLNAERDLLAGDTDLRQFSMVLASAARRA